MNIRERWITVLFYGLYIMVSVATFRHSALGFASIEGGSVVWGALSALAIDLGMLLSATALRQRFRWSYFFGLAVSAAASTYTQLLYSMFTAGTVAIAPGAEWLGVSAGNIINLRVVLLPALLPLLAITYAFAAKAEPEQEQEPERGDDFDDRVRDILRTTSGKGERAAAIWELERNGYGELTAQEVADLAGCSTMTARRAKRDKATRTDAT